MPVKFVYDKLWFRIAEKGMLKKDLRETAGISRTSMAKLAKNENVTTEVLEKICMALDCDISDILEAKRIEVSTPTAVNISNAVNRYGINSFFSGIGGFDIAFEQHGFETRYLCEINDFCNEILSAHWPEVNKDKDINKIKADEIPQAEVWCGGFPCQDISVARGASERLGLNGPRSGLFYRFAELLEQRRPKVVIIENVGGLFNSNGGRDFGVILQKLQSIGYAVAWRLLNSRYFGVPQSRPRVYICCWMGNPVKALSVMFDEEGAHKAHHERTGFLTESNGPNQYPKVPQTAYCLAATSGRHTGTDWSRTYVVCEDGVRRMTPIEYERLQGFPDLWTLPPAYTNNDDTDTLRYTVLGNAVSVPVVEWIAKRVHKQLGVETEIFSNDDLHSQVPEFRKCTWSTENIADIDFSDETKSYKWPRAGLAWSGLYIGAYVPPTPAFPVESTVYQIAEKGNVGERYYLTPNAAEGILRRVDSQGRKLFEPLRAALEIEKGKKTSKEEIGDDELYACNIAVGQNER